MFEGFETSPTRGRKPIGIDTATTQAEPTENGTLKESLWGHSFIKSAPFLIKKWHLTSFANVSLEYFHVLRHGMRLR